MSNELERAFGALTEDAGAVRLEPAKIIRRRGNLDTVARAVGGVAVAAVLVTGVTIGARSGLAGPDSDQGPVPADSAAPVQSFTPPPSVLPSTAPSSGQPQPPSNTNTYTPNNPPARTEAPAPVLPKAIPSRAFLQVADAPGRAKGSPERLATGAHLLPGFCDTTYVRKTRIGIRATQVLRYAAADAPADATPKAAVYEEVLVFKSENGALLFMKDLKAAADGCATQGDKRNQTQGPVGAGDDSVLIEQTTPATTEAGEPATDGSLRTVYFAAIRIGDSVAFVSNEGYESVSADRADTLELARRASARLEDWRR